MVCRLQGIVDDQTLLSQLWFIRDPAEAVETCAASAGSSRRRSDAAGRQGAVGVYNAGGRSSLGGIRRDRERSFHGRDKFERQQPEWARDPAQETAPEHRTLRSCCGSTRTISPPSTGRWTGPCRPPGPTGSREQASALEQRRAEALEVARGEAQEEYRQRMAELDQRAAQQLQEAAGGARTGWPAWACPQVCPWLTGDTSEESQQRVEAFDQLFRGPSATRSPSGWRALSPAEPVPPRPLTGRPSGDEPREINAHWAEIQNTLKG